MYLELTWLNILITLFFIDLHITVIMSTSKYFELADWFDYSLQIYWWGTFMVISRFFLEFFLKIIAESCYEIVNWNHSYSLISLISTFYRRKLS